MRWVVVVASLAAAGCARPPEPAPAEPQPRPHSNPLIVRDKLEQIGRALVLYREEFPAKPVEQWRTIADAGLPPGPWTLLAPGRPWSIEEQDLHYEPAQTMFGGTMATCFAVLYIGPTFTKGGHLRKNGRRQILLYDPYHPGSAPGRRKRRTIVLRWDGTVEEVEYSTLEGLAGPLLDR